MDRINENLNLVYYVINKYYKEASKVLDIEEMFQEGSIGLMKADRTFEENKGLKFSTYATTCIKNEIRNFVRRQNKKGITELKTVSGDANKGEEGRGTCNLWDIIKDNQDYIKKVEDRELIKYIVSALTKEERELLKLRYIDGLTYREVAEKLKSNRTTISQRDRALKSKINKNFHKEVFDDII